jgi:2-(1,2-epoxy-1,2-dihydrophenyl)acetyl-CoA isomerase
MAAFDTVLVDIAGGIATLTLHRPDRLNALDGELCEDLIGALRQVTQSAHVRVVIVTGAGRAFCAGADLAVLAEQGQALVAAGREIALLLRTAPQPVIAAVNGAAAGGGANLALACDYRVASDQAQIGQVFPRLGLGQDWGGSYFLPRLVRPSVALELVWSARMVPAAEALALGLFDRVVPGDRLRDEARTLAAAWAAHPPLALRRVKEGIYQSAGASLVDMLDWEVGQQAELFATPEARERLAAQAAARRR